MNGLNPQMQKSTGVFINKNGTFVELNEMPGNGSLNDIANYTGNFENQFYEYMPTKIDNSNIKIVLFQKFTGKIIAIITNKGVETITDDMLNYFLSNYKFENEFNIIHCIDTIEKGINDGTIDFNFLNRVLTLEVIIEGERYFSNEWLLNLNFENNRLIGYGYSDGVEKWARNIKRINPDLYNSYYMQILLYRGKDEVNIINEINIQFNALAILRKGINNEFIPLHTQNGIINFFMILVCHYDLQITLEQFLFINFGRYELLSENDKGSIFILNNFIYIFSKDGTLVLFKHK